MINLSLQRQRSNRQRCQICSMWIAMVFLVAGNISCQPRYSDVDVSDAIEQLPEVQAYLNGSDPHFGPRQIKLVEAADVMDQTNLGFVVVDVGEFDATRDKLSSIWNEFRLNTTTGKIDVLSTSGQSRKWIALSVWRMRTSKNG